MGWAGPFSRQQQQKPSSDERQRKLEETLQPFIPVFVSNHKSMKASIHNLETQLGQLAKKVEEKFEYNQNKGKPKRAL